MRVVIAGGCKCGKTTAAARYSGVVRHTDDVSMASDWNKAADTIALWFDEPYDCIEGVAAGRGLRRWLTTHAEGKPCDVLIVLLMPFTPLTTFQLAMNKGIAKVLDGVLPQLRERGVVVAFNVNAPFVPK